MPDEVHGEGPADRPREDAGGDPAGRGGDDPLSAEDRMPSRFESPEGPPGAEQVAGPWRLPPDPPGPEEGGDATPSPVGPFYETGVPDLAEHRLGAAEDVLEDRRERDAVAEEVPDAFIRVAEDIRDAIQAPRESDGDRATRAGHDVTSLPRDLLQQPDGSATTWRALGVFGGHECLIHYSQPGGVGPNTGSTDASAGPAPTTSSEVAAPLRERRDTPPHISEVQGLALLIAMTARALRRNR